MGPDLFCLFVSYKRTYDRARQKVTGKMTGENKDKKEGREKRALPILI